MTDIQLAFLINPVESHVEHLPPPGYLPLVPAPNPYLTETSLHPASYVS